MKNTSVHIHLYYEDMGIYLLKKLSKIWNGHVYISLVKNNCANNVLINLADSLFSSVDITLTDNKGNDQYGFFKSFQKNNEDTKWILYWHDKSLHKKEWLDNLTDVFIDETNTKIIEKYTNDVSKSGIISSAKYRSKTQSSENLIRNFAYTINFSNRQKLVRSLQTLVWLKELQFLFKVKYDLFNKENDYPFFTAGTVFLIKRDIIEKVHSIIHDNFFEDFYREDGDVGHALERFYFYASKCMGYNNNFI